jgi:hypothetical protein
MEGTPTGFSLRLFFLARSSPPSFLRPARFTAPFSSGTESAPGTGPDSANCLSKFGRGLTKVCNRTIDISPSPHNNKKEHAEKETYHGVHALILVFLKVKVMLDEVIAALVDGMKHKLHIELSPALFM